jgi:phage baseplate assembly protein W
MPAIKIPGLAPSRPDDDRYMYTDITLDVVKNDLQLQSHLYKPKTSTDIAVSVDEGAIKNALVNLFNTIPGQKVLEPEFGLDLKRFLFEPLTDFTAKFIGETIYNGITRWEPRVRIVNIDVVRDYDNYQFIITLTLLIPKLSNSRVKFTGILSREQFTTTDEQ